MNKFLLGFRDFIDEHGVDIFLGISYVLLGVCVLSLLFMFWVFTIYTSPWFLIGAVPISLLVVGFILYKVADWVDNR